MRFTNFEFARGDRLQQQCRNVSTATLRTAAARIESRTTERGRNDAHRNVGGPVLSADDPLEITRLGVPERDFNFPGIEQEQGGVDGPWAEGPVDV